MFKKILFTLSISSFVGFSQVIDFENLSTLLGYNSFYNGSKSIISNITSGGVNLKSSFTKSENTESWTDWTFSKDKNITLAGFNNSRASITNGGFATSTNYAVSYGTSNIMKFNSISTVIGMQVSNSTYAYLSMKNGDSFSKKFGGVSGTDADYFLVTINGFRNGILNTMLGVSVYLADFRSAMPQEDYILDTWKQVDLSILGAVDSLQFQLISTDNGIFGMNTPAFFVVDNITTSGLTIDVADFENLTLSGSSFYKSNSVTFLNTITSGIGIFKNSYSYDSQYDYDYWSGFSFSKVNNTITSGIQNQYAAVTGKGFNQSNIYAIMYNNDDDILLKSIQSITGFYVTNTTNAYTSMRDGSTFSKKFGGNSGNDADYFGIKIKGYSNGIITDSVTHYLADFRSSVSGLDFIQNSWAWVDVSKLGLVDRINISFFSSDKNASGILTPTYIAIDNFNDTPPVPTSAIFRSNTSDNDVTLFPNPATDVLHIYSNNFFNNMTLIDCLGIETKVLPTDNVIDISTLKSGVYFLKISDLKVIKFIKL